MSLRGVCLLQDKFGVVHGVVGMREKNIRGPVDVRIKLWNAPPGLHGCHIHRSGNMVEGAHTMCDHYNPTGKRHGGLNEDESHVGDFGNVTVNKDGTCDMSFTVHRLNLRDVFGRGLVIHADADDLGRGKHPDSATTGHSGERIYYGIIARDEDCE